MVRSGLAYDWNNYPTTVATDIDYLDYAYASNQLTKVLDASYPVAPDIKLSSA